MDTISRESNNSYLPVAGIIVGIVAIVLSIVALAKITAVGKNIDAQNEQIAQIQSVEDQVRTVTTAAERSSTSVTSLQASVASLQRSTQDAFSQVSQALTSMRDDIAKVQELAVKPAAVKSSGSSAPAVAGADEYIVKGGDTGTKIAANNGVSVADLLAVNPGVNWSRLAVGQKLKLPAKK